MLTSHIISTAPDRVSVSYILLSRQRNLNQHIEKPAQNQRKQSTS
jgi:hypothetical protein